METFFEYEWKVYSRLNKRKISFLQEYLLIRVNCGPRLSNINHIFHKLYNLATFERCLHVFSDDFILANVLSVSNQNIFKGWGGIHLENL